MLLEFWQTVLLPLIVPGVAGNGTTVTASVCAIEFPQALLAVTVMLPLVALEVVLMEVVVELPVHPEGNTQV